MSSTQTKKKAPISRALTPTKVATKRSGKGILATTETLTQTAKDKSNTNNDLEKERQLRNFFQLERDKINSFWEITKNELINLQAELRNKDREMEELEERHQVEIKVYKQKVKHLHYEHQNNLTQLKTEGESTLKMQHDDHKVLETGMKKLHKKIKGEIKETETSHEDMIKNLKQEHEKNITRLRQDSEREAKELHIKYERKVKQLKAELDLRRKNEIHEIEERKNTHINELIAKHDSAFTEIKGYYNDSTANNLELIKSLKEQLEEMKKKEASDQKLMIEVTMENKRLSEPLQKALKEVDHLRHELANYSKDKESLSHTKARVKVLEQELKKVSWEHEVLEQRFQKVQKERDQLYERFVTSIHEVQQKSGLKNLLLEKKIAVMNHELETREAQLGQVIASVNLDPSAVKLVTQKIEHVLEEKNRIIQELQYELARSKKQTNDTIHVYEAKLEEHGVPVEELGFSQQTLGRAINTPANLVAS